MRREIMRAVFTAALGMVAGGEPVAVRELREEEGMEREEARAFIRRFRVQVEGMAAAVEKAGNRPEDVPALFAEAGGRGRSRVMGGSLDVLSEPGRVIGREIARGERAEAELDAFISRRSGAEDRRKSGHEAELEEMWKEGERRQKARRREENRAGWRDWHSYRADLFARLSEEHARKADALAGGTGDST